MKYFLLTLMAALPTLSAQAETLRISCHDQGTRITLESRDLESYQLKENGKVLQRLEPSYQDEASIQFEIGPRFYEFLHVGACIDANGARTKTALVLPEKTLPCSCLYR